MIGWPGNEASRRLTGARRTNYLRMEGITDIRIKVRPTALQFLAWEGRQWCANPADVPARTRVGQGVRPHQCDPWLEKV